MSDEKGLRRFLTPGHAACLAAVLIVFGVEAESVPEILRHGAEVVGALVAIVGLLTRRTAA
jgi:hypothetical protein